MNAVRTRALVSLLALAALVACGGDDDDAVATTTSDSSGSLVQVVYRMNGAPLTDEVVDDVVASVNDRLQALRIGETFVDPIEDDQLRVRFGPVDDEDRERVLAVLARRGELAFRPVLADERCSVAGDDALPDTSGESCFTLGPVGADETAIAGAEPTIANGVWTVSVSLDEEHRDGFDALVAACFTTDATCSQGRLAIVLDGVVQSAPSVGAERIEGDLFISGDFSETEVRDLTAVLRSGALPVQLELVPGS